MKTRALFLITAFTFCCAIASYSQIPRKISFQGALTDPQGKLQPNGVYQVTFALFTSQSGGNAVWTSPTEAISVVNGLFNYIIGSKDGTPKFSDVNLFRPLWLEIQLAGTPLPNRFEITSGMYALTADSARTASNGIPVGTIVAYYADCDTLGNIKMPPDGWMLCNGQNIPAGSDYDQMRSIATAAGHPGKVPDLRGMFLRGANLNRDTATGDADWKRRTGGSSNQKIGSAQADAFQGHWHTMYRIVTTTGNGPYGNNVPATYIDGDASATQSMVTEPVKDYKNLQYGEVRYTSETRPKNVSVNWIIKAK